MERFSVRYIVDDVDAAIPFYTDALGFVVEMHPAPGFAALSRDGARLLLNEPGVGSAGKATSDGRLPRPGGWNRLQVEVADLDAKVASLRRAGRVLRGEPVTGRGGRQVLVEDPSGNPVELFEPAAKQREASAEAAAPLAPLSHSVELELPPAEAFDLFTAGLGEWWPLAYTFTEAAFATARVEPVVGGRWFERDESGNELPWGEVRAYEEGRRLVLSFGIGPDRKPGPPEEASEVEVRFVPAGAARTRVELEHRDFAKLPDGATLRDGMGSPQGWPLILAELRRAAARRAEPSAGAARSR